MLNYTLFRDCCLNVAEQFVVSDFVNLNLEILTENYNKVLLWRKREGQNISCLNNTHQLKIASSIDRDLTLVWLDCKVLSYRGGSCSLNFILFDVFSKVSFIPVHFSQTALAVNDKKILIIMREGCSFSIKVNLYLEHNCIGIRINEDVPVAQDRKKVSVTRKSNPFTRLHAFNVDFSRVI